MARAHFVKRARKDNPAVKAGESYYWWKFRYGPKRYSATHPKRSSLTQSAFYGAMYDLEDDVIGSFSTDSEAEELKGEIEGVAEAVRELGQEAQDSLDAMPEALQDTSSSGEMLTERIDACETMAEALEQAASALDEDDLDEDAFQDAVDEATSICYEGP